MLRQRLRSKTTALGVLARGFTLLAGVAVIWYGLMLVLLAVKLDPGFVDSISGYRTAFDFLAGLTPEDIDPVTRAIVAGAGLFLFGAFGYLALKSVPRPFLTRHDVHLEVREGGEVIVAARAVERAAEAAASTVPGVTSVTARSGSERLDVDVELNRAGRIVAELEEVRDAVRKALAGHDLPVVPVGVTMTGFANKQRRELL